MKNAYKQIIIIFLTSIIFTACKKEEKTLVGTWNATSLLSKNCNDIERNRYILLGGFKCDGSDPFTCYEFGLIFKDDGSFTETFKSLTSAYTFSGNYTLTDEEIEMCSDSGFCEDAIFTNNSIDFTIKSERTGCDLIFNFERIYVF